MARRLSRTTLCSSLAIATALMFGARPAAAQSFIGTVNSSVGANVHLQGNGVTVINVQNTQAVINWTATGASNNGVITFQPAGTTASFRGNSQFAVLNRVTPGVAGSSILLDGIIETQSNNSGGGGTVFFSSPNGVIIGQNAVIDVGSLGLTALPVANDANGNWISNFGTSAQTISFGPAVNPNAFVRINPNATIAVRGNANYIALVAPKVDVQGTIKTDGVAALVAAEQATLTIRDNGLWDIVVGVGTTDPNGINLSGTIARNSSQVGGNHTAYLVSVAKNDAVTMLFNGGSKLGFDVAGSAGVEGNSIVLSAGASVLNGSVAAYPEGTGNSNITLDGLSTDSKLTAIAHGAINVTTDGGASTYGGPVTLAASGQINIAATNNDLTFAKVLTATTDRTGGASGNATAGNINVQAQNGKTLQFAGLTTLSANGVGGAAMQAGGIGGSGTGGTITIAPTGGTVSFNQLSATARGTGGAGAAQGGAGQGGTVSIGSSGGTLQSTGTLSADANGVGGASSGVGGSGTGGTARIALNGGTATIAGLTFAASGTGGAGTTQGGAGSGGTAEIAVTGGTNQITSGAALSAGGTGGNGASGGVGTGGTARIAGSAGTVTLASAALNATATGGTGSGGAGGQALGGRAIVSTTGAAILAASLSANANAQGGTGATGGTAAMVDVGAGLNSGISANNGGTVTVTGNSTLEARARGGAGSSGAGGAATGGRTGVIVGDSGQATGTVDLASAIIVATANGGASGNGAAGGNATGGTALLSAANGGGGGYNRIAIDSAVLQVDALGGAGGAGANGTTSAGAGGTGGSGVGGVVLTQAGVGNGEIILGSAINSLVGEGGTGGAGGNASTSGLGGVGGQGGAGTAGSYFAGTVTGNPSFRTDGLFQADNLSTTLWSIGGRGGVGGSGPSGAGIGGAGGQALASSAQLTARGGTIDIGSASIVAQSVGGQGGSAAMAGIAGNAYTSALSLSFAGSAINPGVGSHVVIDSYSGTTTATAPTGGIARIGGANSLYVEDSTAHFGTYSSVTSAAGGWAAGSAPDTIRLLHSDVSVDEAMTVTTDNRLSVLLDGSTMTAGSLTLDAANFVYDVPPYAPAADQGTIYAGWIDMLSGQDIIMDARLVSGSNLFLYANGLVDLGDLTAASTVSVTAGSTIALGDVDAGGSIWMNAGGSIDAGNLTGYDVALWSSSGDITLGDIVAGGFVDIDANEGSLAIGTIDSVLDTSLYAGTDISVGSITVGGAYDDGEASQFNESGYGQSIDLEADGTIVAGNLTAADSIYVEAGSNVRLGNLSAGLVNPSSLEWAEFVIGVESGGNLSLLDAAAASHIGLGAAGSLVAGAIDSGGIFLALAGGDMSIASILAVGPAYLADASMIELGEIGDDDFDPAPILAATPVRTGGTISIAGPVNAGSLHAAAWNGFAAGGTITTAGLASIDAGGNANFAGDVVAGGALSINADGAIGARNLSSGAAMMLASGGSTSFLNALSGGSLQGDFGGALSAVDLTAAGAMTLAAVSGNVHNLSAGGMITVDTTAAFTLNDASAGSMDFDIGTALLAHDLTTTGNMAIDAGTIDANDLTAGGAISLATTGDATVRNVTGGSLNGNFGGALSAVDLTAAGPMTLASASGSVHNLSAGGAMTVDTTGAFTLNDATAGSMDFDIGTTLSAHDLTAVEAMTLAAASGSVRNLSAGGVMTVDTTGAFTLNDATAGSADFDIGTTLSAHDLTAVGAMSLAAASGSVNNLLAGGAMSVDTSGAFTLNDATAASMDFDIGTALVAHDLTAVDAMALAAASGNVRNLSAGGVMTVDTTGDFTMNDATAGSTDFNIGTALTAHNLSTTGAMTLAAASGSVNNLLAGGAMSVDTSGAFTLNDATAASMDFDIGTALVAHNLTAADAMVIDAGTIQANDLAAGGAISLTTTGNANVHDVAAGGALGASIGGTLNANNLTAGGPSTIIAAAVQANDISSGGAAALTTTGNATVHNITSGTSLTTNVGGDLTANNLSAGGSAAIGAASLLANDVTAGGNVTLAIGNSATVRDVAAGGSIGATVGGNLVARNLTAGGAINLNASTIQANDLNAGQSVALTTLGNATIHDIGAGTTTTALVGGTLSVHDIDAGGNIALNAGTLSAHDLTSGGSINAITFGALGANDIDAAGSIALDSQSSLTARHLTAGDDIYAWSVGAMALGNLDAGNDVGLSAGTSLTTGSIDAGGTIVIAASGDINTGAINAGNHFLSLGGAKMNFASIATGGTAFLANRSMQALGGAIGGGFDVDAVLAQAPVATNAAIVIGGDTNVGSLRASSGTDFTAGNILSFGPTQVEARGDITANIIETYDAIDLVAGDYVQNSVGSILTGDVIATGEIAFTANGTITSGDLTAGENVTLVAPGAITTGDIMAGGFTGTSGFGAFEYEGADVAINGGSSVSTGTITATNSVAIAAVGNIDTDAVSAGGPVLALGGGNMAFGSISAGGAAYLANLSMMALGGTIGETFDFAPVLASAPVASGGSITVGDIGADWLAASAGTSFAGGAIDTWGSQFVRAGTTIGTGALHAGSAIDMGAGTGLAIGGEAYAGGDIDLASTGGPIAVQAIRSDQTVDIDTAGTVTGTTISAGDSIGVWGAGGVTLTDLDAGVVAPVNEGDFDIGVGSNGAISVGAVHAASDVGLAAGGNLTAGSVTAGGDMLALAGGNTILGTLDVGGRLGIAGFGMLATAGGKDDFDKEVVFAALQAGTATATGGSVTINGAVSAGEVDARVGQNLTTAAITTPTLTATVGGTATINGQWTVWDSTRLKSNDIAIGANGGISGFDVTLISSNAAQTLVGDGLVPAGQTAAGYLLDGAEFGRIDTNDLTIVGNGAASGRIDMLIGDLLLEGGDGEGSGEQAAFGQRSYRFVTTSADNSHVEGIMRVVGDVVGPADHAAFVAGTVEVDADTATIALENDGGLTGVLEFVTPHLHVASATVLDKLQANLNYTNRNFDLQTPTATPRPEGVVRADTIYVDPDNGSGETAFTLLVQNTGTSATRAGFLARYAEFFSPEGSSPGAIDMVINGQIETSEGILTGKDVRDALMEEDDPARFKAGSTINGCPVTGGACTSIVPPPPPPPSYDPNPPLQGQLVLISAPTPDKLPFGNEETIEDNQEDGGVDSATSPILAPQPLFDTGPLLSGEETDEPISGGGNPALTGSGTVGIQLDEDEEEKKRKKKAAAGQVNASDSNGKVK